MSHNFSGVFQQLAQKVIFLWTQMDLNSVLPHLSRDEVNFHTAEPSWRRHWSDLQPVPQTRANAREYLFGIERLRNVIVGPAIEGIDSPVDHEEDDFL